MKLFSLMHRAFVALVMVLLMTIIVYPMTAVWMFFFILRSKDSSRYLTSLMSSAFQKPVSMVQFTFDELDIEAPID